MILNVNDKIDKKGDILKYLALISAFLMFNFSIANAQMAYTEEVKALGAVAGQALACNSPKYDTFELLARAIMISKAPTDKMQADGMYAYNDAKANAYISKQMDGFFECDRFNNVFSRQEIFKATLYRDGTIKMPDGKIITPRKPYDASFVYNKEAEINAEAIYSSGGDEDVGEIRIKTDGSSEEIKAIYQPSAAAIELQPEDIQPAVPARAIQPPVRNMREAPSPDVGIGHIKSRWKN